MKFICVVRLKQDYFWKFGDPVLDKKTGKPKMNKLGFPAENKTPYEKRKFGNIIFPKQFRPYLLFKNQSNQYWAVPSSTIKNDKKEEIIKKRSHLFVEYFYFKTQPLKKNDKKIQKIILSEDKKIFIQVRVKAAFNFFDIQAVSKKYFYSYEPAKENKFYVHRKLIGTKNNNAFKKHNEYFLHNLINTWSQIKDDENSKLSIDNQIILFCNLDFWKGDRFCSACVLDWIKWIEKKAQKWSIKSKQGFAGVKNYKIIKVLNPKK